MVGKQWLRCSLLVCGVLLAATMPAYAEPAESAKPIGQVAQSLAISGTVTMAPSLASKGSATDTLFVFARETNGPPMPDVLPILVLGASGNVGSALIRRLAQDSADIRAFYDPTTGQSATFPDGVTEIPGTFDDAFFQL